MLLSSTLSIAGDVRYMQIQSWHLKQWVETVGRLFSHSVKKYWLLIKHLPNNYGNIEFLYVVVNTKHSNN